MNNNSACLPLGKYEVRIINVHIEQTKSDNMHSVELQMQILKGERTGALVTLRGYGR